MVRAKARIKTGYTCAPDVKHACKMRGVHIRLMAQAGLVYIGVGA
jgi:hypothetical protein